MGNEKIRRISEKELVELLAAYFKLQALEAGGVDNWIWYGESLHEEIRNFIEENELDPNGDWDFEDMAYAELESYDICYY
jgi:hypothetical protein